MQQVTRHAAARRRLLHGVRWQPRPTGVQTMRPVSSSAAGGPTSMTPRCCSGPLQGRLLSPPAACSSGPALTGENRRYCSVTQFFLFALLTQLTKTHLGKSREFQNDELRQRCLLTSVLDCPEWQPNIVRYEYGDLQRYNNSKTGRHVAASNLNFSSRRDTARLVPAVFHIA